eukprot:TRINITY_DN66527_c0_g1_i2.p1 TRINITY_DN66527_c0_g1~~TRINITY_DN66527_c0_g1_i2.p1  ORF type:complete len:804 (-),score=158.26 TRINITY_DN66527_c0_g1_i2:313-2583(-)
MATSSSSQSRGRGSGGEASWGPAEGGLRRRAPGPGLAGPGVGGVFDASAAAAGGYPPMPPTTHSSSSSSARAAKRQRSAEAAGGTDTPHPHAFFDGLQRIDVIRLMLQTLSDMGLHVSREALEKESGIQLEAEDVSALRAAVSAGDWESAARALERLADSHAAQAARHLWKSMKLHLLRQELFEFLAGVVAAAQDPQALGLDPAQLVPWRSRLQALAPFDEEHRGWAQEAVLCLSSARLLQDFWNSSGWKAEGSRELLWSQLTGLLSTDLVVPPHRLSALLWQAVRYQELHCTHHSLSLGARRCGAISLLRDHSCDPPPLPTRCIGCLRAHDDEIWFIAASHSGRHLVSSSRDKALLLWKRSFKGEKNGSLASPSAGFNVVRSLVGHKEAVSYIAWRNDDEYFLTASGDCTVRLWSPDEAEALQVFTRHSAPVVAAQWVMDSKRIVTAGLDKKLCLWSMNGNMLHEWEIPPHVQDLAVLRNGLHVLVINCDRRLKMFDVSGKRELAALPEGDPIMSICASRLRDDVLVNIANQVTSSHPAPVVRLWDVPASRVVQRYLGHSQGRFVVRSCFAGRAEEFVISGSEDSQLYIWHRHYGSLLQVLSGHMALVSCVCWISFGTTENTGAASASNEGGCPEESSLLLSASDDKTIRVWSSTGVALTDVDVVVAPEEEEEQGDAPARVTQEHENATPLEEEEEAEENAGRGQGSPTLSEAESDRPVAAEEEVPAAPADAVQQGSDEEVEEEEIAIDEEEEYN